MHNSVPACTASIKFGRCLLTGTVAVHAKARPYTISHRNMPDEIICRSLHLDVGLRCDDTNSPAPVDDAVWLTPAQHTCEDVICNALRLLRACKTVCFTPHGTQCTGTQVLTALSLALACTSSARVIEVGGRDEQLPPDGLRVGAAARIGAGCAAGLGCRAARTAAAICLLLLLVTRPGFCERGIRNCSSAVCCWRLSRCRLRSRSASAVDGALRSIAHRR